jgi:hypothetical protein
LLTLKNSFESRVNNGLSQNYYNYSCVLLVKQADCSVTNNKDILDLP